MKAVIVELHEKHAAALLNNGCFLKIRNEDYTIGQSIEIKEQTPYHLRKLVIWAASVALFILTGSISSYAYFTPYSYVSLDVNPSIEYSLNRFDRVLAVKAVNDAGEEILNGINLGNLGHKNIDEALTLTMEQLMSEDYIGDGPDSAVVIATSAKDKNKADKLAVQLQQLAEKDVKANGNKAKVEAISVSQDRVEAAKEMGVTPGKLDLVEKLKASAASSDSIIMEEWLHKPVREIMKATEENERTKEKITKQEEKSKEEKAKTLDQEGTKDAGKEDTSKDNGFSSDRGKGKENASKGSQSSSDKGKSKEDAGQRMNRQEGQDAFRSNQSPSNRGNAKEDTGKLDQGANRKNSDQHSKAKESDGHSFKPK